MRFEVPTTRYLLNCALRQQMLDIGYLHITHTGFNKARYVPPEKPLSSLVQYYPVGDFQLLPNPGQAIRTLLWIAATGADPNWFGDLESNMRGFIGDIEEYQRFVE